MKRLKTRTKREGHAREMVNERNPSVCICNFLELQSYKTPDVWREINISEVGN